jgi:hypothetical protein
VSGSDEENVCVFYVFVSSLKQRNLDYENDVVDDKTQEGSIIVRNNAELEGGEMKEHWVNV